MDRHRPPPMGLCCCSCSVYYYVAGAAAIITFFIASSPFINAQPLSLSPPSFWTNSPSIYTLYTQFDSLKLTPVLGYDDSAPYFFCGFYCPTQEIHASCLFGVLIFDSVLYVDSNNTYYTENAPQLVWSANRDRPVRINATLQFTEYGDLILEDSDGTFVWSTNTSRKSVFGLKLTESGNLVLFDRHDATVWQSFDHPTDSLLIGQTLVPGQKLTSSTSASNWSRGLYSLTVQDYSLLAYVESNPPLPYFESYLFFINYVKFENGIFNGQLIPAASTSSPQFMRLEPDGHLKVYQLGDSNWTVVADLLKSQIRDGECGYPMSCGNYGICSSNGQCGCLEEATGSSTFGQINYKQPNLGCSPVTPISCDHSQYHTLLELKNTSYFNFNSKYKFSYENIYYLDEKTELEGCKMSCLKNCSCKAAFFAYHVGYDSKKGCLLLSEVFSLINNDGAVDNITVFLKVHKSTNSPQKKSTRVKIILGSSLGAFFGVFFMVALCFFLFTKKQESEEFDEFFVDQVLGMSTRFSYEELKAMTSNFNKKLGEGGFGSVFQGTLIDGTNVAVKRLNGFSQVKKSFLAEVETIGNIHHVNLVRLIGFCVEKSYRLLVYEYMSNGSLDAWIFQRQQELTLGWQSRRKIIMDMAKGLTYLHDECRQKIFHLDIKPQNILLDEDFNAKISDFGLSKLIDKDQSQVVTMIRGTPGYLAPEWLSSIITEKVDVYSFGVVVLEMLCGRKNLDRSQPEEDMHLLDLFKRKAEEERFLDIVDKYNDDMQTHKAEVVEMMRVVVWCLQSDFSRRPSMSVVVKVLEGSVDVPSNLDYNFTTPMAPKAITVHGHQGNHIGAATTLFPSVLSGPS
ncbi:unnamed protein product [Camellia sinensis]